MADVVRVKGYQELIRSLKTMDKASRKAVRDELRHAGDAVKQGSTELFTAYEAKKGPMSPSDTRTAAGYRTIVRQRGVAVEQSIRRTTGKHPEFGSLQMNKALVPSLEEHEDETMRGFDDAFDKIGLIFNGGL